MGLEGEDCSPMLRAKNLRPWHRAWVFIFLERAGHRLAREWFVCVVRRVALPQILNFNLSSNCGWCLLILTCQVLSMDSCGKTVVKIVSWEQVLSACPIYVWFRALLPWLMTSWLLPISHRLGAFPRRPELELIAIIPLLLWIAEFLRAMIPEFNWVV